MNNNVTTSEQRREYFRFSDRVLLAYEHTARLPADTTPQSAPNETLSFKLISRLAQIGHDTYDIRQRLARQHPELMSYLNTLEERVNLVVQAALLHSLGPEPDQVGDGVDVNLSGGGLLFGAAESFSAGTILDLRLVLLPSWVGLLLRGRVVRTEPNPLASARAPFRVAVEFVDLRELDRKLLLKHAIDKQTAARSAEDDA